MRKTKLRLPWFGESIGFEGSKKVFKSSESYHFFDASLEGVSHNRFYIFYVTAFVVLLIFLARLFQLGVIEGAKNRELAENNRIKFVEKEAVRGNMYDRNGAIVAQSQDIYFLQKGDKKQAISAEQAKDLQTQGLAGENFEGELGKIFVDVQRKYPLGEAGAHVFGYVSDFQQEDIKEFPNVSQVNSIGRLGVEETYNDFLIGKPGKKIVEVDTFGKKTAILGEEEQLAGRDIETTVDSALQRVAFDALKKQAQKVGTKRGAVVIQNPQTGEILALASVPSFDPEDIGKSVADLDKPFFDRVTQGSYPPGSVFKVITAFAGLESGRINRDTEIDDVGEFEVGGVKFTNWFYTKYGKKDGMVKIQKAISRSNDIFFYKVAEKIGLSALREMAKKFGFGQKTGIDLPSEAVGLVPDEVWKKSSFGDSWFLGDTMHLGIGQGFMLVTPIQINRMTAYVASGKLAKPYVVSKVKGKDGRDINFSEKVLAQDLVSAENLQIVRAGMHDACKIGGTGAPFFNAAYEVGCKTGTAEKTLGNPHAWFTLYAPFENPQIALTVLVEDGGEGSAVAAPVAKEIVDWWMGHRN